MHARHQRLALAALALSLGCASESPVVEVETRVGAPHEQADLELSRENVLAVTRAALPAFVKRTPLEPQQIGEAAVVRPPRTAAELDILVDAIRTGAMDDIAGPARRLASADPSLWPQIRALLLAERKAPKGDYRSLLDAIGGDVPNRYGHFARAWKKAHGHQVKLSTDWFEDLLALPRGRVSSMLTAVYRDCVLTTAALQAASGIGGHPEHASDVVDTLLRAAYIHDGTFRDEVGRALQRVGNEAIPHLLVASVPPEGQRDEHPEVRRAAYAQVQLDKMDRLHPARAVIAVRDDPRLLAAVLDAYAIVRPGEAASVLLELVDAPSPIVRSSARRAFEAYVTGPAPKSVSRTVRLLGGGEGRARAYLSYRQRATLALRELLQARAPDLLEPACDGESPASEEEDCEVAPERWTLAYYAWLDQRRDEEEIAQIEAALAADDPTETTRRLDRLLAVNPQLARVDRLVPFYQQVAQEAFAQADPTRAARSWRKAAMLIEPTDPELATQLRVRALLAEASEATLDVHGQRMLLETARALAPDDEDVVAALGRLVEPSGSRPSVELALRFHGGLALLGLFMLCVMTLGTPLRRWTQQRTV
jgi:hypothetical protein